MYVYACKAIHVFHQDETTCIFCRKHVKDDENCVTLREQCKPCDDPITTIVGQIAHGDSCRDCVNERRIESSKRQSNDLGGTYWRIEKTKAAI